MPRICARAASSSFFPGKLARGVKERSVVQRVMLCYEWLPLRCSAAHLPQPVEGWSRRNKVSMTVFAGIVSCIVGFFPELDLHIKLKVWEGGNHGFASEGSPSVSSQMSEQPRSLVELGAATRTQGDLAYLGLQWLSEAVLTPAVLEHCFLCSELRRGNAKRAP